MVTLTPRWNIFLFQSVKITLDTAIQNNLSKSWRCPKEMPLVEFRCCEAIDFG